MRKLWKRTDKAALFAAVAFCVMLIVLGMPAWAVLVAFPVLYGMLWFTGGTS